LEDRFAAMNFSQTYPYKSLIALVDAVLIVTALYCAYLVRFDFAVTDFYWKQMISLLPIFLLIRISALYYTKSYHFIWKYASTDDIVKMLKAILGGVVLLAVINYFRNYPLSLLLALGFFISALFHRGFLHFLPRVRHLKLFVLGMALISLLLLVLGVLAYTIFSSAPATVAEMPFGQFLRILDFHGDLSMPRGVLIMETILSFSLLSGLRIGPRLASELFQYRKRQGKRVLIFGAGDVGERIVRALKYQPKLGYQPVGFVDDAPSKQRISIHGVDVLGTQRDLTRLIDQLQVEELLISPSYLSDEKLREIAALCWQKRIAVRRVAGITQMVNPDIGAGNLEDVDIEEFLGRSEVELDPDRVVNFLRGKVVLVTGAGGSIGSELCRQISRCQPARLVLLGKGENSIYQIQRELADDYPHLKIEGLIGDICNAGKMDFIFRTHQPEMIFHAAAYKHVPFMEDSPEESVENNIFGTQSVALAALRHQVAKFVLISSDKAVHPTSMMGVTKRVAELVLQPLVDKGETEFITVRFGNVLRSRGSVIPLFEKQIEAGGPVTVTHPEMKRYFMSIPEAVRLVLHSGTIGVGGDLCILEMGEQVKIVEMVENMIRMAGKIPHKDIDIRFTGIRPGEKLYEELFTDQEAKGIQKIEKIFVCKPEGCDWERFDQWLGELRQRAKECRRKEIVELLCKIVPSYQPDVGVGSVEKVR
jgi:FlaA1/EpsC-like NDP-sugar epimerase